jgi:hypothetical protein
MKQVLRAPPTSVVAVLKKLDFYPCTLNRVTSYRLSNISSQIHIYLRPIGRERTLISLHEENGFDKHNSLHETLMLHRIVRRIKTMLRYSSTTNPKGVA